MHKYLLFIFIIFSTCSQSLNDPQKIVEEGIKAAGGETYLNSVVSFDFRDRHYIANRKGGVFVYERITSDSIRDVMSNENNFREINGVKTITPDSMMNKYVSSLNSVLYFALLPYGLNDVAVKKKFIGEATLDSILCYKIEISFEEDGGGEDHEDVFIYWFNKESFQIEFLAYSFHVDGGGLRFRKAYNPRKVNGILFLDYLNYKPKDNKSNLYALEDLYKNDELELLSKIELLNINVEKQ